MTEKIVGRCALGGVLLFAVVAGAAGFRLVESRLAGEVYRQRLQDVQRDYGELRERYNAAVRRTAVTELLVTDDDLTVRIRTAEGVEKRIETDLDPEGEIYVDFVVVDGRLWIRRLFDARTAPHRGVVIDPAMAEVDWDDPGVRHGQAVYRRLEPGRWVVSITGQGALGLRKLAAGEPAALAPPPEINAYKPVEEEIDERLDEVGFWDMLRSLVGLKG